MSTAASDSNAAAPLRPSVRTFRLPSMLAELQLFWRLRLRLWGNGLSQALAASRLRVATIAVLTAALWVGLFQVFALGFQFVQFAISDRGTQDDAVRAVFNLFFASLTVMLTLSTAIIMYGALFRSDEVKFLLTLPVRGERVFLHKFQESMLFSSWGFVLLGSPMLTAYGAVTDASAYYFLACLPFLLAFAFIPGAIGAGLCLVLVRAFPAMRWRYAGWVGALAAALIGGRMYLDLSGAEQDLLTIDWFRGAFARVRFAESRVLPSWWLSSGLLEASRAGWRDGADLASLRESAWFLALTAANALAATHVAALVARRTLRKTLNALIAHRTARKGAGLAWLDWMLARGAFFLSPRMRLLIGKDLRLFLRDPLQWLQLAVFFAVLALFCLNIRRLSYDQSFAPMIVVLSFVNLAVVGLILSAFTTRFIFPLISLEGRRFWVLGLMPLRRDTILIGKYLFTFAGAAVPSLTLVLFGDEMLRTPVLVRSIHAIVCTLMCSGLSAVAVGLGARIPNLREDSPARIAAGFGGTLNLVIGTTLIAGMVLLAAVPCHRHLVTTHTLDGTLADLGPYPLWKVWAGTGLSAALGLTLTYVPLALGIRAFRKMEF